MYDPAQCENAGPQNQCPNSQGTGKLQRIIASKPVHSQHLDWGCSRVSNHLPNVQDAATSQDTTLLGQAEGGIGAEGAKHIQGTQGQGTGGQDPPPGQRRAGGTVCELRLQVPRGCYVVPTDFTSKPQIQRQNYYRVSRR